MKKIFLILLTILFLTGCVNQQGITIDYYEDCHIEYDNYGTYKEVCPNNILNNVNTNKDKDCLQCN